MCELVWIFCISQHLGELDLHTLVPGLRPGHVAAAKHFLERLKSNPAGTPQNEFSIDVPTKRFLLFDFLNFLRDCVLPQHCLPVADSSGNLGCRFLFLPVIIYSIVLPTCKNHGFVKWQGCVGLTSVGTLIAPVVNKKHVSQGYNLLFYRLYLAILYK